MQENIMKIKGKINFKYKSDEDAKLIYDSLEVDNEDFLKSKITDNIIEYCITSKTAVILRKKKMPMHLQNAIGIIFRIS